MGFLDSIEGMASQAMAGGNTGGVAGGVLEALQQHPGGLGGVLDSFRQNGMGDHADAMQNGEAPPTTPSQVETGLAGTGIIDSVAQRVGVSPEVAKVAIAAALPVIMAHYSQTGEAPSQGALGGVLGGLLSGIR
jgi:uncharacterized protein YidB (DUF937 family)